MSETVVFDLLIVVGFVLLVSGLALWSVSAALVVAGLFLILTGGAGYRKAG